MAVSLSWTSFVGTSGTSQAVTLPSTRANTRIILFVGATQTISSLPNWTQIGTAAAASGANTSMWYRDCVGTSADNATITLSASGNVRVAIVQLPTGSYESTAPAAGVSGGATGSSANPNPPDFASAPFSGSPGVIFFAFATCVGTPTWSAIPTGYTPGFSQAGGVGAPPGVNATSKEVTASSSGETIATYTVSASAVWGAHSCAVKLKRVLSFSQLFDQLAVGGAFGQPLKAVSPPSHLVTPPNLPFSITSMQDASAVTSHVLTLPSGRLQGQMVWVIEATNSAGGNDDAAAPSGWTQIISAWNGPDIAAYCHVTVAGESNSVTFTTTSAIRTTWLIIVLPQGGYGSGYEFSSSNTGTQNSLDPPTTSASYYNNATQGGSYLFAFLSTAPNASPPTLTGYPSGYTDAQGNVPPLSNARGLVWAMKKTTAALSSEDPGVFTYSASWPANGMTATTFALRVSDPPATIRQSKTVSPGLFTNTQTFTTTESATSTAGALAATPLFARDSSAVTNHVITLPTPRKVGQRVIVFLATAGTDAASAGQFPAGWTQSTYFDSTGMVIAGWRDVQAGDPNSITVTTSSTQQLAWGVYLLPVGAYSTRTPDNASTTFADGGTTANIDPAAASISGKWASTDGKAGETYWFGTACLVAQFGPPTLVSYPTGFTEGQGYIANDTTGKGLVVALKRSSADTENCDAFVFSGPFVAGNFTRTGTLMFRATNSEAIVTQVLNLQAPFYTNSQTFYGPSIRFTVKESARLNNAQTFYSPAISRTLKAPLFTNSQTFYSPRIRRTLAVTTRLDNTQQFFGPRLKLTFKSTARFDNTQQFYGAKLGLTLKPSLFTNTQQFYAPTVIVATGATVAYPPRLDNSQVFYAPSLSFGPSPGITLTQTSLFVNQQQFFGASVSVGGVSPTPPLKPGYPWSPYYEEEGRRRKRKKLIFPVVEEPEPPPVPRKKPRKPKKEEIAVLRSLPLPEVVVLPPPSTLNLDAARDWQVLTLAKGVRDEIEALLPSSLEAVAKGAVKSMLTALNRQDEEVVAAFIRLYYSSFDEELGI